MIITMSLWRIMMNWANHGNATLKFKKDIDCFDNSIKFHTFHYVALIDIKSILFIILPYALILPKKIVTFLFFRSSGKWYPFVFFVSIIILS